MPRFDEHSHADGHSNGHTNSPAHGHRHEHEPASPHPAQAAPWSILRMALVMRLATALALSAGLWAAVLLAMR